MRGLVRRSLEDLQDELLEVHYPLLGLQFVSPDKTVVLLDAYGIADGLFAAPFMIRDHHARRARPSWRVRRSTCQAP